MPLPVLAILFASAALAGESFDSLGMRTCTEAEAALTPPTGYKLVAGSANELQRAQTAAMTNAVDEYAAGFSQTRREAVRRNVLPWCVKRLKNGLRIDYLWLGAIETGFLDSLERDHATLSRELDELAGSLLTNAHANSTKRTLVFGTMTWNTGCVAELGPHLNSEIRDRLGKKGGVNVANSGPDDNAHASLFLDATLLPDHVSVAARVQIAGVSRALPGLSIPLDLFRFTPSDTSQCPTNDDLALVAGNIAGSSGLKAAFNPPVAQGVACEGDRVSLSIRVTEPADVHVLSVTQTGDGYHIFSKNNVPSGPLSLGEVELVPVPGGGDERLIVVATPPKGKVAGIELWSGLCRLPAAFRADTLPKSVAVGTTTYVVHPQGVNECPAANVAASSQTLDAAPVCR